MKFSKRYLVFALLLVGALVWKLNSWGDKYAQVETFRGAQLQEDVFYPLMAKNLNESGLVTIFFNDKSVSTLDGGIILNSELTPVVSLSFMKEHFNCGSFQIDDNLAILQITDDIYEFLLGNPTATFNGDDVPLTTVPQKIGDDYYIGLEDACNFFGFWYSYDEASYLITIAGIDMPSLPTAFDLREYGKVSKIRDQKTSASCWACASMGAIESKLLPMETELLSVDHMIGSNSFGLEESQGGEYTMAVAYLLSWRGPIYDKDNNRFFDLTPGSSDSGNSPAYHVQEVHFFDHKDFESIKWAVFKNGGVSTSIHATVGTSNLDKSGNYNKKNNAYCYRGNSKPNHDVVIVGWDDDYPGENFNTEVDGDGAFICQNSWGSDFGDDGVFYISYSDANIGSQSVSYVSVESADNYDNIYQSDLCGWIGQMGYGKEKAWGANVFTAGGDEEVSAAGFYSLGKNSLYELYFVPKYKNIASLANRELVATGELKEAGYYTIDFDTVKQVEADESFAIIVVISTPGVARPVAIEYVSDEMSKNVDITDGKGYVSSNGLDWESIEDVASANLCIKAYSKNVVEGIE